MEKSQYNFTYRTAGTPTEKMY